MHKYGAQFVSLRRELAIETHNKATNIVSPSFPVGEFVLVRRANDRGHKLRFKWLGPCQVIAAHGNLVYGIVPIQDGKTEQAHCARLILYRDTLLGRALPKEMFDLADRTASRYEVVQRIVDLGEAADGLFFNVQ